MDDGGRAVESFFLLRGGTDEFAKKHCFAWQQSDKYSKHGGKKVSK